MKYFSFIIFFSISILISHLLHSQSNSWYQVGPFAGDIDKLAAGSNGIVFAASLADFYSLLHKSTDNGITWSPVNFAVGGRIKSLAASTNNYVYASVENWGFYRSTNNGNSWVGLGYQPVGYAILITPSGKIFASNYNGDVWMSSNEGTTWVNRSTGLPASYFVGALAMNAAGDLFAAATGYGVYRTTDEGINWTAVNTGLNSNRVMSLCVHPSGSIFVGTNDSGIYRSTNTGATWQRVYYNSGATWIQSIIATSGGQLFASSNAGVITSTNNGNSWSESNMGLNPTWVRILVSTSNGSLLAGSDGIFRSTDNGAYWSKSLYTNVSGLLLSTATDILLLGGDRSHRSDDYGYSWIYGSFSAYKIVMNSNGIVYSIYHHWYDNLSEVNRSSDNGMSWQQVYYTSGNPIYVIGANASGHIYIQKSSGAIHSTDDGVTWNALSLPSSANAFIQCKRSPFHRDQSGRLSFDKQRHDMDTDE